MTLTELRQEVYTLTNRPDLVTQTLTAIRAATLKIHQADYFYKDLFETGVLFSSSQYLQSLDYRGLVPQWRALKYLRKTDASAAQDDVFFKVIPIPEAVEDQYLLNQNDVCYVAGSSIQIRSSTLFRYALLGCYINPIITEAGYNSWLALDHPYAVIFIAAATVFKAVGDTEQFAAFTMLAAEQLAEVKLTNIQAIGY